MKTQLVILASVLLYINNHAQNNTLKKYNIKKVTISDNNIKKFSLENKIFLGKIVNVYDGDTCKIIICFKDEFFKFNVRMIGYDSPELKSKNEEYNENVDSIIIKF